MSRKLVLLLFLLLVTPLFAALVFAKGEPPPPPPPPCPAETPSCYKNTSQGTVRVTGFGQLARQEFAYWLTEDRCKQGGGCACYSLPVTVPLETDGDDSSSACACIAGTEWLTSGTINTQRCCGDDDDDCGRIQKGILCSIDTNYESSVWLSSTGSNEQNTGDIRYVGCAKAEYLSDGTTWIKCDGTFWKKTVGGYEYVCIGMGRESIIKCCGDESCKQPTDGKKLGTGQVVISSNTQGTSSPDEITGAVLSTITGNAVASGATLNIIPPEIFLGSYSSLQLVVEYDSDGSGIQPNTRLDTLNVSWSSYDSDIVDIVEGELIGYLPGTTQIMASFNGTSATAQAIVAGTSYRGNVTGTDRSFMAYAPENFDINVQMPLVIVLHPDGTEGKYMEEVTFGRINELANQNQFIVVYPDGIDKSWNDGRGTTQASSQGINDVQFISTLIDFMWENFNIDKDKVYVVGFSNGAIMAQRLGCELSDSIAAVASVSGSLAENLDSSCTPQKHISMLMMHGMSDPLSPYNGGITNNGAGGSVLSVNDTAEKWAQLNECSISPSLSLQPDSSDDGTLARKATYPQCTNGTEVIVYHIEGGGHTWPKGLQYQPESTIGKTSNDIDASQIIWDFLSAHSQSHDTSVGITGTVSLKSDKIYGQLPLEVTYTATLRNMYSCGYSITWDFGDGVEDTSTLSCDSEPYILESSIFSKTHTYATDGKYQVTVTANGTVSNMLSINVYTNADTKTYYCRSDKVFVTDLDTPVSMESDSSLNSKNKKTCEFAGFKWTGTKCCSEADDIGEYYDDKTGGCWNGNPIISVNYVPETAKSVININGRFNGCALTATNYNSQNDNLITLLDKHTKQILVDDRSYCYTDQSNDYYCSYTEEWLPTGGSSKNHLSIAPFEGVEQQGECCASDECWDGQVCVENQESNPLSQPKEGQRCIDGAWSESTLKLSPDETTAGYCSTSSQCLVSSTKCIDSGQYDQDNYCENGNWSSRTKFLALELLNMKEGSEYKLFCDTRNNTLNNLQYLTSSQDLASNTLSKIQTNNFCVMGNNNKIILATSINKDIEEIPPSDLDIFGVTSCDNIAMDGNYHPCDSSNKVWYNKGMKSLIYSSIPINVKAEGDLLQLFLDFIKNPLDSMLSSIDRLINPVDDSYLKSIKTFNKLYMSEENGKQISGSIDGRYLKNLVVKYSGFDLNVCSLIDEFNKDPKNKDASSGVYCEKDDTSNTYFALAQGSAGNNLNPEAIWPDLTAKLRTSGQS